MQAADHRLQAGLDRPTKGFVQSNKTSQEHLSSCLLRLSQVDLNVNLIIVCLFQKRTLKLPRSPCCDPSSVNTMRLPRTSTVSKVNITKLQWYVAKVSFFSHTILMILESNTFFPLDQSWILTSTCPLCLKNLTFRMFIVDRITTSLRHALVSLSKENKPLE